MPSKNASQSKPGASFWYSGSVIGLWVFTGSRFWTLVHW